MIETARLLLRKWVDADTPTFIRMNKDESVMQHFPKLLTDEETMEMVKRIKAHFEQHQFGLYAVEEKSTAAFIGFTGFAIPRFESFFTPCVEIGWRYQKESWGKGFATEAASACLQYGFEQLTFDRVVSFTATTNQKSEQVMKRIGMRYVADFDHPLIETGHTLCRHVLYEVDKPVTPAAT